MNRRTALRTLAGVATVPVVGRRVHTPASAGSVDTDPFEPLGIVDVEGAKDAAVHHDGEVVYVAAGDGFASVDISEPADPTVLAERRDIDTEGAGPFRGVWDLWPWEDRLAVVGPANADPGAADGLALFDISDPADPDQVAFFETDYYIHNSYFDDGIVYLVGSGLDPNPVVLVDVTDDDPEEVGRWDLTAHDEAWADVRFPFRTLHDLFVRDGIAYLAYWDAGTWLVDVSDPADIEFVSRVGGYDPEELQNLDPPRSQFEWVVPPGNHHYAQPSDRGDLLAVGVEAWALDTGEELIGGPGSVHLYDITDETEPEHLVEIEAPASYDQTREGQFTTAHNLDIVDDRLYTSWYFGGVKIHDVSDPADPEELAWWLDPEVGSFWTAQSAVPGEYFVASSAGDVGAELGVDHAVEPRAGLFVFPDRPGEQPDPLDLTAPTGSGESGDGSGDEQSQATGESEDETSNDGTDDGVSDDQTDSTSDDEHDGVDETGPGFGIAAALAGLGGGYFLRHRTDERE